MKNQQALEILKKYCSYQLEKPQDLEYQPLELTFTGVSARIVRVICVHIDVKKDYIRVKYKQQTEIGLGHPARQLVLKADKEPTTDGNLVGVLFPSN